MAWTHARSISYLADTRSSLSGEHQHKLMNFYHYCFYLPLLPSGPLILYREFKQSVSYTSSSCFIERFVFSVTFHVYLVRQSSNSRTKLDSLTKRHSTNRSLSLLVVLPSIFLALFLPQRIAI